MKNINKIFSKNNKANFLSIGKIQLLLVTTIILLGISNVNFFGKNPISSFFFSLKNVRTATLELTKSVSNSTPESGETFVYTLQYRCASTTDDCLGTYITDPLPSEVQFVSIVNSVQIASSSYNSGTHSVTFNFIDPLSSGTSGQVEIHVQFPNGSTPDGTVASNSATIDASNATAVTAGPINVTATAQAKIDFEKYFGAGGAAGGTISYGFKTCNTGSGTVENGTLNLTNISIRDTFPPNTTLLNVNNENGSTHVYDPISHSIILTFPNSLGPGECAWPKVTLGVPSPYYNIGDVINNNATIYYTPTGESPTSEYLSNFQTLTSPNPEGRTYKQVSGSNYYQGNSGSYEIDVEITGTEDLNDFCMVDTIPNGLILSEIHHGGFFYAGLQGIEHVAIISYETNLGGPYVISGSPFSIWNSGSIDVYSDLGLPSDDSEYITVISWCFGDMYAGFSTYRNIVLDFKIETDAPIGTITNCAEMTSSTTGVSFIEDCVDFTVNSAVSGFRPSPTKYVEQSDGSFVDTHTESFSIGDTARFRLRVRNSSSASGDFPDPIAADFLPEGLDYVNGSWSFDDDGTGAPSPIFTESTNFNGSGRTLLKWEWTGTSSFNLQRDDQVNIYFDAVINNLAPPGYNTLVQELVILNNTSNYCSGASKETDDDDLDEDGNTSEEFCVEEIFLNVDGVVGIESEMLIKGQLDSTWTKYPSVGLTVPGGVADYILEIRNLGNVALDSIIIIDILPHIGDAGVIDLTNRNSRWQPNLVSTVDIPAGVTVYYSTEGNPCRDSEGFVATGPLGCTSPGWTTTPTDLTNVRSLKFDFGSTTIDARDTFRMEWAMRTPVGVLATIGVQPDSIAWNSFGYIAQRVDNGDTLLATEPIKVGMNVTPLTPGVIGDWVWEDSNGNDIQNGSELGIDGVRVELFKDNGDGLNDIAQDTFINFTLTANGGYYLFPNLESGDYYVVFYKPNAYDIVTPNQGGNAALDSDGIADTYNGFSIAKTSVTNITNLEYDLDWDLGLVPSLDGAVGDYVWHDINGDGIQNESAAAGVNGIKVYLYNVYNAGQPYASAITQNDVNGNPGYYYFDNIPATDYHIRVDIPSDVSITIESAAGATGETNSNINPITKTSPTFQVLAGEYNRGMDIGLLMASTEICNNGLDDDGDDDIDCADSDCSGDDNDGDGICDFYDLDDDNDGILDDVETLGFSSYDNTCTIDQFDFSNPVLESGVDETVGAIYRYSNVITGTDALVEIVSMTNATLDTIDAEDGTGFLDAFQPIVSSTATGTVGVEFNFKFVNTGTNTLSSTINRIGGTAYDLDGGASDRMESYRFESPVVAGLDNPTFLQMEQIGTDLEFTSNGIYEGTGIDPDPRLRLYFLYKDTNEFTVHVQQKVISGVGPRFYSLRFDECEVSEFESINLFISQGEDTDGDGIENHLDLDSDNDGIFDVDEAGHAAVDANNDGVIDGAPSSFGTNGVFDAIETSPDSDTLNYAYSDSEITKDSLFDFWELDSDGDSCTDAEEEGISDLDTDGIAGTGTPTVDANGLVTSITYSSPSNNNWQDSSTAICLLEICNNGIDDDGDGLIDCFDCEDCEGSLVCIADNDSDNIGDECDDDDDNDGILDIDEGYSCTTLDVSSLNGSINSINDFNNAMINLSGAIIQIEDPLTFGGSASLDEFGLNDNHETGTYGFQLGVNSSSPSDFLEAHYSFSNPVCNFNARLLDIDVSDAIAIYGYLNGVAVSYNISYQGVCVAFDSFNTFSSSCLANSSPANGNVDNHAINIYFNNCIDSLVFRSYENGAGSGGSFTFVISSYPTCSSIDTDGDGIPDYQDLDSDNDGCYDTEEESVPDSDNDGIAGTGIPAVNGNGLVTSITYVSPPNNIWQDSTMGPCLPEICNDGIDNDVDGDEDCDDSDCDFVTTISPDESICPSTSIMITATGGASYLWSTTETDSAILVTPLSNTIYTVTITNVFGCTTEESVTISLENCTEVCFNNVDDDGDGDIDENDDECTVDCKGVITLDYYSVTATGSGSAGMPTLNYTPPSGKDRLLLFAISVERDHFPLPKGDNWATNSYGTPNATFGGVSLKRLGNNRASTGTGGSSTRDSAQLSLETYYYSMEESDIPVSGAFAFSGTFNTPNSAGDEMIIEVMTFANVDTLESTPANSVTNDMIASSIQTPGSIESDNMLIAHGKITTNTSLEIGTTWSEIGETVVFNSNGSFANDPGRTIGVFTEDDGLSTIWQTISQVTGSQTASINYLDSRSPAFENLRMFRLVSTGCASIYGNIFEDINYGGGDGRNYLEANTSAQASGWGADDIGVENVTVELYDSSGEFISSTATDVAGDYNFSEIRNGNYSVRVVNNSVTSNRSSNTTGQTIIPVQTFRADGTTDFINVVGGNTPSLIDAGPNNTFTNISLLTTGTSTPQSVTSISINGSDVTGVDFGYNYDVIVNTNNSGQGSLRQFILNSNELVNTNLDQEDNPTGGISFPKNREWETSIFMISGIGKHMISPTSSFNDIEDEQTHITGYTQSGSSQGTITARTINVELDGNAGNLDGFRIYSDSIHISGFAIHSFRKAVYSYKVGTVDNFIWGNYIGTESDGTTVGSNSSSAIDYRNILNSAIGTNGDNINDANEGNIISNSFYGIDTRNNSNLLIAGNYIGLDKTGNVDLGNDFVGVYLGDATGVNYVGFKDGLINTNPTHFRNVIGGNGNDAVRISDSDNQVVAGNYLGTNAAGTAAIGNENYGIQIQGTSSNNIIGTNSNGDDDISERNIISGNGAGIRTLASGTGINNKIAGNYIGTDVTGNNSLPNLTVGISMTLNNMIIGTNGDGINDEVEGNVISGNITDGIRVDGSNNSTIAGNKVGVGADGITQVGNGSRGIIITTTSNNNTIGYLSSMTNSDELIVGNQIKYNEAGIALSGTGTSNRISRNQISENEDLGIDLTYDLVTPNDNGDGDSGANNLLNFPVIDAASVVGNILTITGYVSPGAEVEFFIADDGPNPNPLPAGFTTSFGEGTIYLFSQVEGSASDNDSGVGNYTEDGTGATSTKTQNRFEFTFDVTGLGFTDATSFTSTAIDGSNNTSEFSGVTTVCFTPIANNAILNTCDNSNETGFGVFFLHDANSTVSSESGVSISYHSTLADASNGTNVLISPYSSSDVTVYVRVERVATGCYNTALVTLDVGIKCTENCNNGIDEDGDGLTDCEDSDCPCCEANTPTLNGLEKKDP